MKTTASQKLFVRARKRLVGGVNSPVRAFLSVGGDPLFIVRGKGAHIWDADGNKYLDFVGSWGPLILGHAHPGVLSAVKKTMSHGLTFGAPTELEIRMAELVCEAYPSMEKVRFVSSGTEAVMTALRLARAFTGRDKIVKFSGCYHGHSDGMLVKAGSGAATLGIPDSLGVPKSCSQDTLVLPYNDLAAAKKCFEDHASEIAAVILEPVVGNMGLVLPKMEFLEGLRALTARWNSLLIFDEVINGFRLAFGGAQEHFGIRPDLTCLGKIIGGGLPVGAVGGRADILDKLAPLGPVYQAGTLSGNPAAMAAGIATLSALKKMKPWDGLRRRTDAFVKKIQDRIEPLGLPVRINHMGSLFTVFFIAEPVTDYDSAKRSDTKRYAEFFHALLEKGIYFPPAQFEAAFVSCAHTDAMMDKAAQTVAGVLIDSFKS